MTAIGGEGDVVAAVRRRGARAGRLPGGAGRTASSEDSGNHRGDGKANAHIRRTGRLRPEFQWSALMRRSCSWTPRTSPLPDTGGCRMRAAGPHGVVSCRYAPAASDPVGHSRFAVYDVYAVGVAVLVHGLCWYAAFYGGLVVLAWAPNRLRHPGRRLEGRGSRTSPAALVATQPGAPLNALLQMFSGGMASRWAGADWCGSGR
jgi:hypothetical protein